jgi:hypothetical protein
MPPPGRTDCGPGVGGAPYHTILYHTLLVKGSWLSRRRSTSSRRSATRTWSQRPLASEAQDYRVLQAPTVSRRTASCTAPPSSLLRDRRPRCRCVASISSMMPAAWATTSTPSSTVHADRPISEHEQARDNGPVCRAARRPGAVRRPPPSVTEHTDGE